MKANLPAQRTASPQIPAEFWTRFEARIVKDAPQLRLRERQPALATQSSAIGQSWGMRIGAEVGASLEPGQ